MNRDKLIAIVLVVGLVFMMVALVGVVTVTGLVLVMTNEPVQTDTTPIINSIPNNQVVTPTNPEPTTTPTTPTEPAEEEEPEPVCGNGKTEGDEKCEADSDCDTDYECDSCECIKVEPKAGLLEDIEIDSISYWCPKNFTDEDGLAISMLKIKNNSDNDFSYAENLTITITSDYGTSVATTENAFDFLVKAGKTVDIFRINLRENSDTLLVGESFGEVKITIEFGKDYYFEYEYNVTGNDFSKANCQ